MLACAASNMEWILIHFNGVAQLVYTLKKTTILKRLPGYFRVLSAIFCIVVYGEKCFLRRMGFFRLQYLTWPLKKKSLKIAAILAVPYPVLIHPWGKCVLAGVISPKCYLRNSKLLRHCSKVPSSLPWCYFCNEFHSCGSERETSSFKPAATKLIGLLVHDWLTKWFFHSCSKCCHFLWAFPRTDGDLQ